MTGTSTDTTADLRPDAATRNRRLLALLFATAGLAHFVVPALFEAIVPPWLPHAFPDARTLVVVSGVAEIAGAIGLLLPATRVAAAWGLLALLVAVFPANVHMLLAAYANEAPVWWRAALWVRLPLQPALMWWVWRSAIGGGRSRGA